MRRGIVVPLTLTLLVASGVTAAAREIAVNCGTGGDLALTLQRVCLAPRMRPLAAEQTVIVVSGTCTGNFSLTCDNVVLRGADPATSTLRGLLNEHGQPAAPVLSIRNARGVGVQDLLIRDGTVGILARESLGYVTGCLVEENDEGIRILSSPQFDVNSTIVVSSGGIGIRIAYSDSVRLDGVAVGYHPGVGVAVQETQEVVVHNSEIGYNLDWGIWAYGSHLIVADGTYIHDNNGEVLASDLGEVEFHVEDAAPVAPLVDGSGALVLADTDSYVEAFAGDIVGDLAVMDGSGAYLYGGAVYGLLYVLDFSQAVLDGVAIGSGLECYGQSDAVCYSTMVPYTYDCPGALDCVPYTAAARPEPGKRDLAALRSKARRPRPETLEQLDPIAPAVQDQPAPVRLSAGAKRASRPRR